MLIDTIPNACRIQSEEDYIKWLASLNDGDYVLLQKFVPPTTHDIPIECWRYEKVMVVFKDGKLYRAQSASGGGHDVPLMADGHATYWNNDNEISSHVFGDRLVPYVAGVTNSGGLGFAFNPIYEPLWSEGFRYKFLYTDRVSLSGLRETFPAHYRQSTCDGMLFVGFSQSAEIDTAALESKSCQFLYRSVPYNY